MKDGVLVKYDNVQLPTFGVISFPFYGILERKTKFHWTFVFNKKLCLSLRTAQLASAVKINPGGQLNWQVP